MRIDLSKAGRWPPYRARSLRTFEYLRIAAPTVETVTVVYIVDAGMRLVGVCSMRDLLLARMHQTVDEVMTTEVISAAPDTDQQDVARLIGKYDFVAAAIVVRGLDTGHVSLANWANAVRRELLTALTIALVAGVSLSAVAMIWSRRIPFGLVVGASMTCAIVTAGLMGTVIPMLSKKAGFDPATTAGPFETAFQDVIGFSVFLWMAQLLIRWL